MSRIEAVEKLGNSQERSYRLKDVESIQIKPFLKWAGGKSQLKKEIEKYYPFDELNINKYAEPFVGGGAILFDILSKYDLDEYYISDINDELINTYIVVRDEVDELVALLSTFQSEFIPLDNDGRKKYYLEKRSDYNQLIISKDKSKRVLMAALMIFLNKTCFNGLYRVNKKGLFNVPMGSYKNPLICDEENLRSVSKKLKKTIIVSADYRQSSDFIDENTFVYIDPPYRPLTKTANFTSYSNKDFDDQSQLDLANYIRKLDKKGAKVLVSNSDPKNIDEDDNFFDCIYSGFRIERVEASRMINSKGNMRGRITELLISNF